MSRIGELLIKHGIITKEQLEKALRLQETSDKRLGAILIELGYVSSDDLHWMLSEQANIPFVDIQPSMLDGALIMKFPKQLLYEHVVVPLHESETRIYIAVGDPTDNTVIERIENVAAKIVVASGAAPEKVKRLLDDFFAKAVKQQHMVTCVRMSTNNADIEFINIEGKRIRKSSPAEIEIRINSDKGETEDE